MIKGIAVSVLLLAGTVVGADESERFALEIPAQRLDLSLRTLAEALNAQTLFSFEVVSAVEAPPLSGRYTPTRALEVLLAGSGLYGRFNDKGVILVCQTADCTPGEGTKQMRKNERGISAPTAPLRPRGFLLTALAALFSTSGVAQDNSVEGARALEEVIVTATRRGESRLLDTPIAISVLQGSDIEDNAVFQLADVLKDVPSVGTFTYSPGDSAVQIRGISALSGASTVGYYLDEFPFPAVNSIVLPDVDPYDLQRLEVLRGPQGTLYGDGSIGGTVRIITREPDLESFQFKASGSYFDVTDGGSNEALNAGINVPIIAEKLAFRGVATQRNFGGFMDNGTTGEEDINSAEIESYRAKLKYQASDSLSMVATGWFNDRMQDGRNFGSEDRIARTEFDKADSGYDLYNLTVAYQAGSLDIISSTSLFESDSVRDAIFPLIGGDFIFGEDNSNDTFTQELRVSGTLNKSFSVNGGLIYSDTNLDTIQSTDFAGFVQDVTSELSSESWAIFGELHHYSMDERLELTFGVRYYEDDRSLSEVSDSIFMGTPLGTTDFGVNAATFDAITPRFNAAYQLADGGLVFASVAKGFRPGQLLSGSLLQRAEAFGVTVEPGVDPDEVWNLEFGYKKAMYDGGFVLDLAAYYIDWSDVQIVIPILGGSLGVQQNGADAEVIGVEFGITARPTDRLTFTANGNFNTAEFVDDIPTLGIESGDQLDNSIREQFAAAVDYAFPLPALRLTGVANASVQWNSAREIRGFGVLDTADDITNVGARIGVEADHWGVYLIGTNLTDETGATGGTGGNFLLRMQPRSIGISARVDF
ncbi:TonB-dependent receptor [Marinobacter salarius]|uniref:TonB-dependent receptor n=1 Tax=Marinobacter salarius TaxID=1420917 RepID=UPI0032EEAD0C